MPSVPSSSRRRKTRKSPLNSILVVGVALSIFVVSIGLGVWLLDDNAEKVDVDTPAANATPQSTVVAATPPISTTPVANTVSSGSDASSAGSSTSSAASSSSSSSSSASQSSAGVFDPAIMGVSGFANIPSFQKINEDVKGWIKVPDTNIDYPVLYDPGVYPNANPVHYYLDKDIYKQKSKNGVIYADPGTKFGTASEISRNTVMYGHNWTNVSANPRIGSATDVMFAQLTAYHHLDFAKSHPYIYYSTASQEMTWVVFAAFYTDVGFIYNFPDPDDTTFVEIIKGARARSRHIFDVPIATGDKIITLSTCTRAYGQSDRQRFVVMARLLRAGEKIEAVNVTANPNPVLPVL